ncbi:MAG: hypothetical protein ABJ239_10335 [Erythrobacter sp.]
MRAFLTFTAATAAVLALQGCSKAEDENAEALHPIARDYVLLQLTIGEKEDGYIDAYYGPEELQAQATSDAAELSLDDLSDRVSAIQGQLEPFVDDGEDGDTMQERRARFLFAQMTAAQTRLKMLSGENVTFVEEAKGLFGVEVELVDLDTIDPIIAQIDDLLPGEGPLWQRLEEYRSDFVIPENKLQPVMDAAIAECRSRTAEFIDLPEGESFTLELVSDKPWGGYNYYQGGFQSKIEVNTDSPARLSRAVDLGCHEGYPGHHVLHSRHEQELVNKRGWLEFSIVPLFSPQAVIAEGSANYGIELAFPGEQQLAFDTDVIAPIAGISADGLADYANLSKLTSQLSSARYTISARYLDGEIGADDAALLLQKYQLSSPDSARQSLRFIDTYRSYIINYGLGLDLVRASVEAAGDDQDARWARMIEILSEPTLPSDLKVG